MVIQLSYTGPLTRVMLASSAAVKFDIDGSDRGGRISPERESSSFVCCVIHPTNEVLGSDVIPRWALIGWLISLCQV